MTLRTHPLHHASLFRVSYSLSVAISTPIALPAVLLVLWLLFQLMAQSTFDERLVHFSERGVHVIACMQQSRRVCLCNSTHISLVSIILSHFIPIVKRLIVLVEWLRWFEGVRGCWFSVCERRVAGYSNAVSGNERSMLPEWRVTQDWVVCDTSLVKGVSFIWRDVFVLLRWVEGRLWPRSTADSHSVLRNENK
jgi:hypothetical protein